MYLIIKLGSFHFSVMQHIVFQGHLSTTQTLIEVERSIYTPTIFLEPLLANLSIERGWSYFCIFFQSPCIQNMQVDLRFTAPIHLKYLCFEENACAYVIGFGYKHIRNHIFRL